MHRSAVPLLLLALGLACAGGAKDRDLDGYAADVDCDDNSSAIHPSAIEACDNGLDDDCDGATDGDDSDCGGEVPTGDHDGDGYEAPYDCDDDNAYINPDAVELCGNNQDDDCDEDIDEDDDDCDSA